MRTQISGFEPSGAATPRIAACASAAPRALAVIMCVVALTACSSTPEANSDNPVVSKEAHALEKELDDEAAAVGTAQAIMSMPAAWDPTGAASLVTIPAGLAAREAQRRRSDAKMKAQQAKDDAEFYRQYGLNPDGSPSGRKGPLSED